MNKWNKVTLSTSLYVNKTYDFFQFIKRPNGEIVTTVVNGVTVETPVIVSTPINLSDEVRFGFEFTVNYTPYKWWKLNGNFNFFQSTTNGDYSYTLQNTGEVVEQNFDKTAASWFTRVSSKITLPYKVEWQVNGNYNAPQNNAQGKSLGVYGVNLAFSKDILNDKGTLALNVNDLFNSRKRISETHIATLNSYSEMQWRQRQINLSFTYRFNKTKTDKEKEKKQKGQDTNDSGDFPG